MLTRGKVAGHNGIITEIVKNLRARALEILTKISNETLEEQKMPEKWEVGILLPIFKKEDYRGCTIYWVLSIQRITLKLNKRNSKNIVHPYQKSTWTISELFRKDWGYKTTYLLWNSRENLAKNIYVSLADIEQTSQVKWCGTPWCKEGRTKDYEKTLTVCMITQRIMSNCKIKGSAKPNPLQRSDGRHNARKK